MSLLPLVLLLAPGCRSEKDVQDTAGLRVDNDGDGAFAQDDCDDNNNARYPGNTEVAYNGVDDDCDDATLDDDLDQDGYGLDQDCDDGDALVNPAASELCDGVDNDCSGEIDDAVGDLWYDDDDGDSYGDPDTESQSCDGESGQVADNTDCNDAEALSFPGNPEVCDGIDNDCSGSVDDGVESTFYADADGDGHGDLAAPTLACEPPSGYTADATDCDDTNAQISPVATEICDTLDNNCDGDTDEDSAADASTWYSDSDGDTYGDASASTVSCSAPSGYVADDSDCDDGDVNLNPDTLWYQDADSDSYGNSGRSLSSCEQPSGYVSDNTDCEDLDAEIHPAASEVCDGIDNDCDTLVDDDDTPTDPTTWYSDSDADGYGDSTLSTSACDAPTGYVADNTDCDDTALDVNPGETEVCDGTDHDCDGDVGLSSCEDCEAILTADSSSTDGVYTIDIDGSGSTAAFDVYCDMTTDGGGWSLWWWFEGGSTALTGVGDTLGGDIWDCDPSSDDACLGSIPITSPVELMVLNQVGDWAVWEFDSSNDTASKAEGAFVSGSTTTRSSSAACGDAWTPVAQGGSMTDNPYHCDENNNSGTDNCDCFWYDSYSSVYSFYLDDDTGWAETAFGAGYDNSGSYGVDSLETSYRYHNITSHDMYLYWR